MPHFQTKAVQKLRKITKPIRVIQGGTSAGKTEGIIGVLIHKCSLPSTHPDYEGIVDCTVVAESIPALKDGAIKIFINTMQISHRWSDDHYNYTDRIYKFSNGSKIQFKAFDTIGKAKAAGKRTHLFVNECQYVPFPIVDELMIRTYKEIWFDYNPNNPFYIQEEIIPRDDADLLILTYEDNEATPQRVKDSFERKKNQAFYNPEGSWEENSNIKSSYHANWCRVYIRGELGSLEGVIFQNWSIIDTIPQTGLKGYGMDFGYSNDPSTWIACYVIDGRRVFDEVIYQKGLDNRSLAAIMNERGDINAWTYADRSDPRSIDELYSYGIRIRAAGGDSEINFGIGVLQEEPFYVTARSVNLIKELREYSWDRDKEGNLTGKPIGIYNHAIDAMRYFAMENLSKSSTPMGAMVTLNKYA